jgi:hypothetical protein
LPLIICWVIDATRAPLSSSVSLYAPRDLGRSNQECSGKDYIGGVQLLKFIEVIQPIESVGDVPVSYYSPAFSVHVTDCVENAGLLIRVKREIRDGQDAKHDEAYRRRWRYKVARLEELFQSKGRTDVSVVNPTTEPTYEELKAQLAELEAKHRRGSVTFRVGDKGGVSVYGLGRFPVTLYYEQWVRLLDNEQELREFLQQNKGKLKLKK